MFCRSEMRRGLTQSRRGAELFLVWLFLVGSWAKAALELGLPFGDHAVLQAGKVLPVWGKAVPGAEVQVNLGDRKGRTTGWVGFG